MILRMNLAKQRMGKILATASTLLLQDIWHASVISKMIIAIIS